MRLPMPDCHESSTLNGWLVAKLEGFGSNGSAGVSSSTTVTVATPSIQPGAWAVKVTERGPFTCESLAAVKLNGAEVRPAGMMTLEGTLSAEGWPMLSDTTRFVVRVPGICTAHRLLITPAASLICPGTLRLKLSPSLSSTDIVAEPVIQPGT